MLKLYFHLEYFASIHPLRFSFYFTLKTFLSLLDHFKVRCMNKLISVRSRLDIDSQGVMFVLVAMKNSQQLKAKGYWKKYFYNRSGLKR